MRYEELKNQVVVRQAESHPGGILAGSLALTALGYATLGPLGAIALGLIGAEATRRWFKSNTEAWEEIEEDNLDRLLKTPKEKQIYAQTKPVSDPAPVYPSPASAYVPARSDLIDLKAPSAVSLSTSSHVELKPRPKEASFVATPPRVTEDRCIGKFAWLKQLRGYNVIRIRGPQGSGKSTLIEWLISRESAVGRKVTIWNPHAEKGQYQHDCVGGGMAYNEIESAMCDFIASVQDAYEQKWQGVFKAEPETIFVEEFTNYCSHCPSSERFIRTCFSDIRKADKRVIFVSHGRTLGTFGNAKGLREVIDEGLIDLELKVALHPETGKPHPALKGVFYAPAMAPMEVDIPAWLPEEIGVAAEKEPISVEKIYKLANGLELPASRVKDLIEWQSKLGVSMTEIVKTVWGVKSGEKYQKASAEYKEVMGEAS